jgi:hypothetical protein
MKTKTPVVISGDIYDQFIDELIDFANYHNNVIHEYRLKEERRKDKNDRISEGMQRYWYNKKKKSCGMAN